MRDYLGTPEQRHRIGKALRTKIYEYPDLLDFLQAGPFQAHPEMLIQEMVDVVVLATAEDQAAFNEYLKSQGVDTD